MDTYLNKISAVNNHINDQQHFIFHISSHSIAFIALIIACFAVAGYIRYRVKPEHVTIPTKDHHTKSYNLGSPNPTVHTLAHAPIMRTNLYHPAPKLVRNVTVVSREHYGVNQLPELIELDIHIYSYDTYGLKSTSYNQLDNLTDRKVIPINLEEANSSLESEVNRGTRGFVTRINNSQRAPTVNDSAYICKLPDVNGTIELKSIINPTGNGLAPYISRALIPSNINALEPGSYPERLTSSHHNGEDPFNINTTIQRKLDIQKYLYIWIENSTSPFLEDKTIQLTAIIRPVQK